MMRKSSIPQPKYAIGQPVMFMRQIAGDVGMQQDFAKVKSVQIYMDKDTSQVKYTLDGYEGEVPEGTIVRRVGGKLK